MGSVPSTLSSSSPSHRDRPCSHHPSRLPGTLELSSPISCSCPSPRLASLHPSPKRTLQPPLSQTPTASKDGLDLRSGFLPHQPPLSRLPAPWSVWEDALEAAQILKPGHGESKNLNTARWRMMIREELPLVDLDALRNDIVSLRRAHLVLAFLMHFYVHSDEPAKTAGPSKVPKTIAIPLCAVSAILDIPPVLTYSDTVLYNWKLLNPALGFTPANIAIQTTFTGTESEKHFYKTSVLVEVLGPTCLSLMKLSLDEALVADTLSVSRIAANLRVLSVMIDRLREVLERVREGCIPGVFYWEVRPWFNGGEREMEGVWDPDKKRTLVTDYGGPSAGQTTLIHALDVFLGVDHGVRIGPGPTPAPPPSPGSQHVSQAVLAGEETFMERMAAYMPHHHRHFLSELARSLAHSSRLATFPALPDSATHSIRSLALASDPAADLRLGYNEAVAALGRLRGAHSKIVLFYIVSQSRQPPPAGSAFTDAWLAKMEAEATHPVVHIGTGGTDLAKFLKRCKERTSEAMLDES